jgi:oligosaccharyltransferase complex subunit gamma
MRFLVRILLLVVLASVFAVTLVTSAKKDSGDALADKVQQLMDLSAKRPVIKLNGNKFRDYVRNAPRNYSMIVMFTALSAQRQVSTHLSSAPPRGRGREVTIDYNHVQ